MFCCKEQMELELFPRLPPFFPSGHHWREVQTWSSGGGFCVSGAAVCQASSLWTRCVKKPRNSTLAHFSKMRRKARRLEWWELNLRKPRDDCVSLVAHQFQDENPGGTGEAEPWCDKWLVPCAGRAGSKVLVLWPAVLITASKLERFHCLSPLLMWFNTGKSDYSFECKNNEMSLR